MQKYEFTPDTLAYHGHTLHRIRALRDFGNVKAGDLGGWIQKERNLSEDGDCWVADEAKVLAEAHVRGNAQISGNAEALDYAIIRDNAQVKDNARMIGETIAEGNAVVCGKANLLQGVHIKDYAQVGGCAFLDQYTELGGCASVFDSTHVLNLYNLDFHGSFVQSVCAYRCADDTWQVRCNDIHPVVYTFPEFKKWIKEQQEDLLVRDNKLVIQEYGLVLKLIETRIKRVAQVQKDKEAAT